MLNKETVMNVIAENKISLRAFAKALELSYQPLLKASKKPIAGETYDPDAINYDAIYEYVAKRIDKDFDILRVDWSQYVSKRGREGSTLKTPDQINIGDLVYLRIDKETPYEIIYTTSTHVVLMKQGTEEPIAWSWNTFFFKGPKSEPRTSEEGCAEEE